MLIANKDYVLNQKNTILTISLFFSTFLHLKAQQTQVYTSDLVSYNKAIELFQKEKFGAAIKSFEKTQEAISDKNSEVHVNSTFYKAICALNLFHKDAEFQLRTFIETYPESPKVALAFFELGKYNYRKKKWENVIYWLDKTDALDLSKNELLEYNFRKGYAYFRLDSLNKASAHLHELIDIESNYYVPANYYYAHIAYYEGNYQTALLGFNKLRNDKKFGVITPYYIAQIYYHQEDYDSLVAYASPMLEKESTKRKPEIAKLLGNAYFQQENYEACIPHLDFFLKEGDVKTRLDFYQLGFAYYKTEDYENAIKYFSRVSSKDDELTQKAAFNLGECYILLGNKQYASNAYKKAYELDFIDKVSQESLLNYAKLSYELAIDPYNQAINAFIEYLQKYPEALNKDEAYKYLVNIYLSSKNYRSALASLETTKVLDPRLNEVYQQLQFNLGVEQFQNNDFENAITSFDKSMEQPENKELAAVAKYWKAESHFRKGQYALSIEHYKAFIFEPRAFLLPEFKIANYSLGYAYYKGRDYVNGAKWFRKYLTYHDLGISRKHDALVRTGDCYFISKQYLLSEEYYQQAYVNGGKNADYALYQYATCQGLLKKKSKQIASLESLIELYPESGYTNGAYYELGKNYMLSGNDQMAILNFNKVINAKGNHPFRKKSLEQLGLIYYNNNQSEQALSTFKMVVSEYPNYSDSRSSLSHIQSIYKDLGNIDDYEKYINTLSFIELSTLELDSITYTAAEDFYLDNNLTAAIPLFQKYLTRFNPPIFANKAHFYLAESLYATNQHEQSYPHYNFNVSSHDELFYSISVERSAELAYKLEKYNEAIEFFTLLESTAINADEMNEIHWWKLKSANAIDSVDLIISEGLYLLNNDSADDQRLAHINFMMANSHFKKNQLAKAMELYTKVNQLTQQEMSAESLYRIAYILFESGQIDSAEVIVQNLMNHTPTYADWLAKGLILLADIYEVRADYFQSRTTLESVIENYRGDDVIIQEAKLKLDELNRMENEQFDQPIPEPEVIELGPSAEAEEEQDEETTEQTNLQQSLDNSEGENAKIDSEEQIEEKNPAEQSKKIEAPQQNSDTEMPKELPEPVKNNESNKNPKND